MRRLRSTKILATLGPASSDAEMVEALHHAGADIFRLNFSHGTADDHRHRYKIIRDLEHRTGRPIGIMADLQGPKIRIGCFKDGSVTLEHGAAFRLDLDKADGDESRVALLHPEILESLEPGTDLLLDDGKLKLTVTEVQAYCH